ncbi:Uncharacterised protein [Vibrio cholerae]|nr:Uncharacterised protein [Vibrio cholerae]
MRPSTQITHHFLLSAARKKGIQTWAKPCSVFVLLMNDEHEVNRAA